MPKRDDTFDMSEQAQENAMVQSLGGNARTALRTYIERAEALNAQIDDLKADLKEVMGEAKGEGFDVKIMRKVITRRKRERAKVQEEDGLLELYETAVDNE